LDEAGTDDWNPEGTFPLAPFDQNEDHEEEEVTPPHPSTVGCQIILHKILLMFKENMEIADWIDKDRDDISDCNAEGRDEDTSELTKAIPEWMPNDAQRSQLLPLQVSGGNRSIALI